jgi:hypothetical protein
MLDRILPRSADNNFRGRKLALWLFGVVILLKTLQGVTSMVDARSVAARADGIPFASYPPGAAATGVALFALLGFALFVLGSLCMVVLARYRSLVPLMFTVLALHYLGGRVVLYFHPLTRTGTAGGVYINMALFVLMIVGLALSLAWPPGNITGRADAGA